MQALRLTNTLVLGTAAKEHRYAIQGGGNVIELLCVDQDEGNAGWLP